MALVRILGKCGTVFATAVKVSEEQDRLRQEIMEETSYLEDAIRLAVGRPGERAHADAVVAKVRAFRPLIHRSQCLSSGHRRRKWEAPRGKPARAGQ